MTESHRVRRGPLALAAGIAILVFGHSALQESAEMWVRGLPYLLILILGELVREWTTARLAPTLDEPTTRARRRLQWIALVAGIGFLGLPVGALATEALPKHSLWFFPFLAAGICSFGVFSAAMLVESKAKLDAKLAEAARTGVPLDHAPPGPFVFMVVLGGALVLFAMINAGNIEMLVAGRALSAMQSVRVLLSAIICGGFAFLIWRTLNSFSDRLLDQSNPEVE